MRRFAVALAMIMVLLSASFAVAQDAEDMHWKESPLIGAWQFNAGLMFFSDQDFQDVYGNRGMVFYNMQLGFKVIQNLELTGLIGYGFSEGRGVSPSSKSKTDEWYKLHLAPGGPGLTYRFNFWLDQPIVPYVGGNGVVSYWMEERMDSSWKRRGYSYGAVGNAGLMFLLDKLEKRASGSLEANWGINNTYLFYEYRYTWLDDFGDETVVDLSSHFHSLGIMFEF